LEEPMNDTIITIVVAAIAFAMAGAHVAKEALWRSRKPPPGEAGTDMTEKALIEIREALKQIGNEIHDSVKFPNTNPELVQLVVRMVATKVLVDERPIVGWYQSGYAIVPFMERQVDPHHPLAFPREGVLDRRTGIVFAGDGPMTRDAFIESATQKLEEWRRLGYPDPWDPKSYST
jgi:hypothetical protein